jgi:hypothetical protein
LPDFDVHCPLLSLPLAFGTQVHNIPQGPYLRAPAEHVHKWRGRLLHVKRPAVGLVWSGRAAHGNDRNRSISPKRLSPLFGEENIGLVSLQRELRNEDAGILDCHPRLLMLGEELTDFCDTAAVISLLDLVVTVDTSVAHLAGALGAPTWILVPAVPDFRWMRERTDSPWYPTARLFRQPSQGDWGNVIERVCTEVRSIALRYQQQEPGSPRCQASEPS